MFAGNAARAGGGIAADSYSTREIACSFLSREGAPLNLIDQTLIVTATRNFCQMTDKMEAVVAYMSVSTVCLPLEGNRHFHWVF